ncbi:MAG: hypothetical protein EAZ42_10550 [Verrucomicrobia bacterium]|nr:MAG: hypothetical protein EAZ42_10550 [Verrucomicrobiota bacterium]
MGENSALLEAMEKLFASPENWQIIASGQASGKVSRMAGKMQAPAIRFEYDFAEGGGFVVMRKVCELQWPETFELGYSIRGEGPPNHFEIKLISADGSNVWRALKSDFAPPSEWTKHILTERDFLFAWGPAGGGSIAVISAIEVVVAAGPGGRGVLEFSDATMQDQARHENFVITASSSRAEFTAQGAFSNNGWMAAVNDQSSFWQIDLGRPQRMGGVVIDWLLPAAAKEFSLYQSDDGKSWSACYQAEHAVGARTYISLPRATLRWLKFVFGDAASAAVRNISIMPDSFSQTPHDFIHAVAKNFPRGSFPRYWLREQSYWTPVGSPSGKHRALINEEGMIEPDEGSFSLEPFVLLDDRLLTWADVEITAALDSTGAPTPSVRWGHPDFLLEILPWMDACDENFTLRMNYRWQLKRTGADLRLVLLVRPYQVNPPWQAFRHLGGRSEIKRISMGENTLRVEGSLVLLDSKPAEVKLARFDECDGLGLIQNTHFPKRDEVFDEQGLAAAVMVWNPRVNETTHQVTLSFPYTQSNKMLDGRTRDLAVQEWRQALASVIWQVPAAAEHAVATWRTAAGHILINRDGAAIQPGPRRYTRSWVRDCVVMGAALAKAGLPEALREFVAWYAAFQRDDGYVPSVVDRDGVDDLVEHDSHGQLCWGIAEALRGFHDDDLLEKLFPVVQKAAEYLIELRSQRMTPEYQDPARLNVFGLLPESASHEGYLAHPVHSYWDDFWGIRGLQAAAELAILLDQQDLAAHWSAQAADFETCVIASIERVIEHGKLHYIPGSVEWADFDPTAVANAICLLDFADALPQEQLRSMMQTYLCGMRKRHDPAATWLNYSAYEIRIMGALVRIGERDAANELLDYFLLEQRPISWNQWPEITWRDPRAPGHLGDVPHTWIAAEYLLAWSSMVAAEHTSRERLVLASGLRAEWISSEQPFWVKNFPTRYGLLDFSIHALSSDEVFLTIGGMLEIPRGGLWVHPPQFEEAVEITAVPFDGVIGRSEQRPFA